MPPGQLAMQDGALGHGENGGMLHCRGLDAELGQAIEQAFTGGWHVGRLLRAFHIKPRRGS